MRILCVSIFAFLTMTSLQEAKEIKSIKGTYRGTINSLATGDRKLVVVITGVVSSNGLAGSCSGYSTVNGTNKTFFTGTFTDKATGQTLKLKETGNKNTDGKFDLYTCDDPNGEYEYLDNSFCGKWNSYNGKWSKSVLLRKD